MKNYISILFVAFMMLVSIVIADKTLFSNPAQGQNLVSTFADPTTTTLAGDMKINYEKISDEADGSENFFSANWGALVASLLAFCDVVVRLTPSVKDNSILSFVSKIFNYIIPNRKTGGGTF